MNIRTSLLPAILAPGAAFTTTVAHGAWIIPVSASASSEQGTATAVRTIDGVGLSAESPAGLHNASATSSWSMQQGGGGNINTEFITFDLGAVYDLTVLHVWQFTRNNTTNDWNRGVRTFDVFVSTDNVSFTEVSSDLFLNRANGPTGANVPSGNEPVQSFPLIQSGVQYVELRINGTYERPGGDRDWQGGFAAVRFEGDAAAGAAIPEPSSTLLFGLGAFGMTLLRRRRH